MKFPILSIYRILLNIGAILIFIMGVVYIFRDTLSSDEGFSFLSMIVGFVPFFAIASLMAFVAELIKLGLRIEKHLSNIAGE